MFVHFILVHTWECILLHALENYVMHYNAFWACNINYWQTLPKKLYATRRKTLLKVGDHPPDRP